MSHKERIKKMLLLLLYWYIMATCKMKSREMSEAGEPLIAGEPDVPGCHGTSKKNCGNC